MAATVSARLSVSEGRKFAFTVGGAFLLLALIAYFRGRTIAAVTLGAVGLALGLLGAVAPTHLGPIQRAWMSLAHAISKVTTPLFMAVTYFLVITPVGLLRRATGARSLEHKLVNDSYWQPVAKRPSDDQSMLRQF